MRAGGLRREWLYVTRSTRFYAIAIEIRQTTFREVGDSGDIIFRVSIDSALYRPRSLCVPKLPLLQRDEVPVFQLQELLPWSVFQADFGNELRALFPQRLVVREVG